MLNLDVRSASDSDRHTVIGVITLAFATDPMARWAFPDPATYLAVMPQIAAAFGGNSLLALLWRPVGRLTGRAAAGGLDAGCGP